MKRVLLALFAVSLTGCYMYVPVDYSAPPAGAEVRGELSRSSMEQNLERFGAPVERITGRIQGVQDDQVALFVDWLHTPGASFQYQGTGPVRLARSDLVTLEAKQFSWTGTVLLGAAVVVGLHTVNLRFGRGSIGQEGEDDEGDPDPDGEDDQGWRGLRVTIPIFP